MAQELVSSNLALLKQAINEWLSDKEAWEIVLGTSGVTLTVVYIYLQLTHKHPLSSRLKKSLFRLVRRIPYVRQKIEQEMQKVYESTRKETLKPTIHLDEYLELPEQGKQRDEIVQLTKTYMQQGDYDWTLGTLSGTVYDGNPELTSMLTEVYGQAAWTNPLHAETFPGVRKMEAEIVRMTCDLFHGHPTKSCGSVTGGGTESIILACKAYRDYAREVMGISDPVIVAPVTAHAAFDKAAGMLDIGIVHVPVHQDTMKVDLSKMRKAITSRTCMLVGSAPQFPHGCIDDIQGIAALGKKYGIPVHVDACLGGFLIAFMNDAGFPLAPFDFGVDGVTSISADTHKYGYAPKGSSVIMYSKPEYRHHQWFTISDWPGGIYATTTIGGSRAGGIIAACWASLLYYGRSGYVDCTRKIIETTKYVEAKLKQIDGVVIVGKPEVSVVAFTTTNFSIYTLTDELTKLGWNLNILQFPECVHLCCTMVHTKPGVADKFVEDVRNTTLDIARDPSRFPVGSAAIYGTSTKIPDRRLVDQMTWAYLDNLYAVNRSE